MSLTTSGETSIDTSGSRWLARPFGGGPFFFERALDTRVWRDKMLLSRCVFVKCLYDPLKNLDGIFFVVFDRVPLFDKFDCLYDTPKKFTGFLSTGYPQGSFTIPSKNRTEI